MFIPSSLRRAKRYTRYNLLVRLYPVYTWYKPRQAKLSNGYQVPDVLPNSRKVLPTFRTFCPDGVQSAQMGSLFAHFQVQARLAVRHAVTVSLHAVKLLYTATFQWGLKVATHCCVVVHQCFIRDQPDTTEISQIQLAPAVTWHGGRLGGYWGPTACRARCTFRVS